MLLSPCILSCVSLVRYDNEKEIESAAKACIARYGSTAEHSYEYFVYYTGEGESRVFFQSPEGFGMMAYENTKQDTWELVGDPIAPPGARAQLITEFVKASFSTDAPTMSLEILDETYRGLCKMLPAEFSMSPIIETLIWPCVNLRTYDTALRAPQFKSLRNVRSRFSREHTVSELDAHVVASEQLHAIVDAWTRNRSAAHHPYTHDYHQLIDDLPSDKTDTHALIVDGTPEALFAGWPIPHTNGYYLFLSLHTYAHWGLGEMLMMRSIGWMQHAGFAYADLGGSDAPLYSFKKQFGAVPAYETHRVEIIRREALDLGR